MHRIELDRDLAFAAGWDAANRRMRAAGRTAWDDDDREIAVATTNRLLLHVPAEQGGLKGIELTERDRENLGLA